MLEEGVVQGCCQPIASPQTLLSTFRGRIRPHHRAISSLTVSSSPARQIALQHDVS